MHFSVRQWICILANFTGICVPAVRNKEQLSTKIEPINNYSMCSPRQSNALHHIAGPTKYIHMALISKLKLETHFASGTHSESDKLTILRNLSFQINEDSHHNLKKRKAKMTLSNLATIRIGLGMDANNKTLSRCFRKDVSCIVFLDRTPPHKMTSKSLVNSKRQLSGKRLRLATLSLPPFVVIPHDPQRFDDYTGFVFEVVRLFSQNLNFTYEIIPPPDGAFGAFVNGTWNGMVRLALENTIDLAVAPFSVLYGRAQVINYVWPLEQELSSILIPAPQENVSLWAFSFPFHTKVWLCILAALLWIAVMLWLMLTLPLHCQLALNKSGLISPSLGLSFLFAFGVVSGQAGGCSARTHSSRIVAGVWCLAAVIIVYSYTSSLISYLSVLKLIPIIETLEELAFKGVLLPVVIRYSSYEISFISATTSPFSDVGNLLRKYPTETLAVNNQDAVQRVLSRKFGYIIEIPVIEDLISKDWQTSGKCRLSEAHRSREAFPTVFMGLITPKNGPYNDLLHYKLRQFHEHGFIKYTTERTKPKPNPCISDVLRVQPKEHKLQLKHVESPFFLLGLGTLVSLFVFALEHVLASYSKVELRKSATIP